MSTDPRWASSIQAALYSNRAFAHMKQGSWDETESDCTQSLSFNPEGVKALYRRALAREALGRGAEALKDAEAALRLSPEAQELQALCQKLKAPAPSFSSKPAPPASSPPSLGAAVVSEEAKSESPKSQPQSPQRRGRPVPARTSVTPSVPSVSPKNSFELLRHFNSLKKYPEVLSKYVSERVPPELLQSCFSKSPIEADDLATALLAIRTGANASSGALLRPELVGEYLRQLLRTCTADMQFSMLSSSEKEVIRELLEKVPPAAQSELKSRFEKILRK